MTLLEWADWVDRCVRVAKGWREAGCGASGGASGEVDAARPCGHLFVEVCCQATQLLLVSLPSWKEQGAEALDQFALEDDRDVVVPGELDDFIGQVGFADADHVAQQAAGFAHGKEVFFKGFGLADGELILDAAEEGFSVGIE